MPVYPNYTPLKLANDTIIVQKKSGDLLKLLGANTDILTLGDATHEGGDLKIYRDGSGNLQLSVDADAASNTKALDVYGGVVAQHYLTVGQAALNTGYSLYVYGDARVSLNLQVIQDIYTGINRGIYVGTKGVLTKSVNDASLVIDNSGITDANNHTVNLKVDSNDIIVAQATGNGAGGIVGKRSIQYGGQCHAKTDAGAADYNPSAITSDYIITVDTTAAARAVTISTEDRDSGTAANPRVFIIKDIAGNAAANNITVSLETAGTIDGAATFVINGDYNSVTLMIDGTNGYIV